MQALMTKRKKPSVKIVTGNVNNINKGLMAASKIDNTVATINAVNISLISIPGNI